MDALTDKDVFTSSIFLLLIILLIILERLPLSQFGIRMLQSIFAVFAVVVVGFLGNSLNY